MIVFGDSAQAAQAAAISLETLARQYLLARSAGRIVSRDELTAVLHQRESNPYERSLDVHISHLRKKLEPAGSTALIHTRRGLGYTLKEPE